MCADNGLGKMTGGLAQSLLNSAPIRKMAAKIRHCWRYSLVLPLARLVDRENLPVRTKHPAAGIGVRFFAPAY